MALDRTVTDVVQVNGSETVVNKAAFSVHRNGVLQAVPNIAPTKLLFTTKEFDEDKSFDTVNSRFAPKPGKYMLMGAAPIAPGVDQAVVVCMIYKNGVQYKSGIAATVSGVAQSGSSVACMVIADPGDYFEMWVVQVSGAPANFVGAATDTWFQGFQIG